jgi:hypothetical protein
VKKIQLWSDENGSEFALCFSGTSDAFLAKTSPNSHYVRMVEEAEYIEGERYDWPYMLTKWIDSRSGEGIATWVPHISDAVSRRQSIEVPGQKAARKKRKKYTKQTPTLKCHFCGLMYVSEREREGHEKEWHAAGQKKSS